MCVGGSSPMDQSSPMDERSLLTGWQRVSVSEGSSVEQQVGCSRRCGQAERWRDLVCCLERDDARTSLWIVLPPRVSWLLLVVGERTECCHSKQALSGQWNVRSLKGVD